MTHKQSKRTLQPTLNTSQLTLLRSLTISANAAASQYEDEFTSLVEITQVIVDDIRDKHKIKFVFLKDIAGFMWTKNGVEITQLWSKDTQMKCDLCAVSALLWQGLTGHEVWRSIDADTKSIKQTMGTHDWFEATT